MATAALRGLLVVAALALGFFVLSKAFPSGGEPPVTTPGTDPTTLPAPVSPSVPVSPTRDVAEPLDPSDLEVQVLNGTEVSGLASDTAEALEEAGYQISTVGDAETAYDTTTIFHLRKRKADAQILQGQFFPTAVLQIADQDTKVDMTVILGTDFAEAAGTDETPAGTPTETPA